MIVRISIVLLGLLLSLNGCTGNAEEKDIKEIKVEPIVPIIKDRHVNISVLVDLSNRIDRKLHPEQAERDITVINSLSQIFKKNIDAFGAFKANAKFRVYFNPESKDPEMATIARNLIAECEAGSKPENAKHNKLLYASVDSNLSRGLLNVYSIANNNEYYPGSNIWRFMKDEARVKCIDDPKSNRNILVILTDGYLYYKNEMHSIGNRYSYIERNFDHFSKFRNSALLNSEFNQKDYGIEATGEDLKGLEVIVIGISPEEKYPQDFDIIQKYWGKWFDEMNIKHSTFIKTEQPIYTLKRMNDFFTNKDQ